MIRIYHNSRCRKSRETLALLREKGVTPQIIEYLKDPPSKEVLRQIIQKLGVNPEELIRKSEPDYKAFFKGKTLSEDDWLEAIHTYPKLMERPIVINGDRAVIGRPPENILKLL